jgi:hypothetical protein
MIIDQDGNISTNINGGRANSGMSLHMGNNVVGFMDICMLCLQG